MKEIIIGPNDHMQRLDRFLKKYLYKAGEGFIQKTIRKKNIKVNDKRAYSDTMLEEGDRLKIYLSDETIEKFRPEIQREVKGMAIDIVYEDDNIVIIDKPKGVLSHGDGKAFEKNIVDGLIEYLIVTDQYHPRIEKTFTPSICNRLDRNTSGLIIGAKNYQALKLVNQAIKSRDIKRKYLSLVEGALVKEIHDKAFMTRDPDLNISITSKIEKKDSKDMETILRPIKTNGTYSLVEVELITGRTHQIRTHLSSLGYKLVGDRKYGSDLKGYPELDSQFLHGYKLEFYGMKEDLAYLNGKTFESELPELYRHIIEDLFKGDR